MSDELNHLKSINPFEIGSQDSGRYFLIEQALAMAPRAADGALKRARLALDGADEAFLIKAAGQFALPDNGRDGVAIAVLFGALMPYWSKLSDSASRRIAFERIGAMRFKPRLDGSIRPEGARKPDPHEVETENSAWRRAGEHWMRSCVELSRGAKIPKELLGAVIGCPFTWLASSDAIETPDLEQAREALVNIRQIALRKWTPSSDDALENASRILARIEPAFPVDAPSKIIARELDHLSCMLSLGYGRRAVEVSLSRLSTSEVAQAFLGELLPGMAMAMTSCAKAESQRDRPTTHGSWRSWSALLDLPLWQPEALEEARSKLARVACEQAIIEAYHAARPKGPSHANEEALAMTKFGLPAWSRMQKKWIETKTDRTSTPKAPAKRL